MCGDCHWLFLHLHMRVHCEVTFWVLVSHRVEAYARSDPPETTSPLYEAIHLVFLTSFGKGPFTLGSTPDSVGTRINHPFLCYTTIDVTATVSTLRQSMLEQAHIPNPLM